ncbi:MAG: sulfatase-like hydrolase/transferase, partial [Maribacter sp.]|nr:sulfatase-like hydrolase/transferase [Maribacter sp.]
MEADKYTPEKKRLKVGYSIMRLLIIGAVILSCEEKAKSVKDDSRPNILWIYLEDTAPLLGGYGTTLISTPNIDKLANEGVLYKNAYMPAPVCSVVRSSIITGTMATTLGAQNHHSSRTKQSAIPLPDNLQTIPEVFKEAGYFTFNNGKDDYNFIYKRSDLYSQEY